MLNTSSIPAEKQWLAGPMIIIATTLSTMTNTTVLITGANRGLGKGLLARYLIKPNYTVIAANRDPGHPSSIALQKLPKGPGSQLIVIQNDASIFENAAVAVADLQTNHGITHIDIVIANAGIANVLPTVANLNIADLREHVNVNLYGVVALFQAVRGLLKNSCREPMFLTMGTFAASLTYVKTSLCPSTLQYLT